VTYADGNRGSQCRTTAILPMTDWIAAFEDRRGAVPCVGRQGACILRWSGFGRRHGASGASEAASRAAGSDGTISIVDCRRGRVRNRCCEPRPVDLNARKVVLAYGSRASATGMPGGLGRAGADAYVLEVFLVSMPAVETALAGGNRITAVGP
jgi:hypothetical protein